MIISHACRRNRSADNLEQYRAARKHCKVTLREAKSRYALQVRDSTANQKLVSGFLKGVKKSMSEEKFIIPTLKNGLFEHRYGNLSRKVNFLSTQFAKNSTLVDGDWNPPLVARRIALLLLLLFERHHIILEWKQNDYRLSHKSGSIWFFNNSATRSQISIK